jgi:DNA-binding FadR family transcriptional regulator
VRLKAGFDVSGFPRQSRVVLRALQRYGMILADNGSPWYVSGASNPSFNDDDLRTLNRITGADLEVVDTSTLRNGP